MRRQEQDKKVTVSARVTLADLHKQIEAGEVKELRVILKGDVHGSVEALQDALERLSTDEVKVKVIHGVGRAPSPRPTSCWPRRRTPSSSGST